MSENDVQCILCQAENDGLKSSLCLFDVVDLNRIDACSISNRRIIATRVKGVSKE